MAIRTQRVRGASGFAVVCAVGMLGTAVAQSTARSFHFDITNQSLSQALRNFAHVCGQEVVFTEDTVAGQATSLKGDFTVQAALDRLLKGTDLVAERSSSGAIMIRRRSHETGADVRAPISFGTTASAAALQVNTAAYSADAADPAPRPAAVKSAAAAAVPSSSGALEEVIVSGTKRAENVQSVPNSVFVATAASMERANIRDFDDLVKIAPSLTITKTSQPANNSINIRGIGTYAYSIATEPSVAVVVDDIPQAFQAEAFARTSTP